MYLRNKNKTSLYFWWYRTVVNIVSFRRDNSRGDKSKKKTSTDSSTTASWKSKLVSEAHVYIKRQHNFLMSMHVNYETTCNVTTPIIQKWHKLHLLLCGCPCDAMTKNLNCQRNVINWVHDRIKEVLSKRAQVKLICIHVFISSDLRICTRQNKFFIIAFKKVGQYFRK